MNAPNHIMKKQITTTDGTAEKPRVFLWEAAAAAVRVVGTNEEPLFVSKDVCSVLGISKYLDAIARVPDWAKGYPVRVDTLGGPQEMATLREAGLYWLILRSDKPLAEPFQRWVCEEVLPQIRKTGSYAPAPSDPYQAKLAPHAIEIFHRPQPPAVVADSEEQIVAQLLFGLLNHRARVIMHGVSIVDAARRDEEFAGWLPDERPSPFRQRSGANSGFMRRLHSYFGRPLLGCFTRDARVQITPQGHGAGRRYVITSWRVEPAPAFSARTHAHEAIDIVDKAINAGEQVSIIPHPKKK